MFLVFFCGAQKIIYFYIKKTCDTRRHAILTGALNTAQQAPGEAGWVGSEWLARFAPAPLDPSSCDLYDPTQERVHAPRFRAKLPAVAASIVSARAYMHHTFNGVQTLYAGFETCFGWDPRHQRCWDPVAKTHLESRCCLQAMLISMLFFLKWLFFLK